MELLMLTLLELKLNLMVAKLLDTKRRKLLLLLVNLKLVLEVQDPVSPALEDIRRKLNLNLRNQLFKSFLTMLEKRSTLLK